MCVLTVFIYLFIYLFFECMGVATIWWWNKDVYINISMGDSELKEIKTSNHWRISCHFREVQNAHLLYGTVTLLLRRDKQRWFTSSLCGCCRKTIYAVRMWTEPHQTSAKWKQVLYRGEAGCQCWVISSNSDNIHSLIFWLCDRFDIDITTRKVDDSYMWFTFAVYAKPFSYFQTLMWHKLHGTDVN